MRDAATKALVTWQTKQVSGGFGCYRDRDIVELDITKSDPLTYWNPGAAQNVQLFLLHGNFIIGLYITDMTTNAVLYTSYYFTPMNERLADQLFGESGTGYHTHAIKVIDPGQTKRCPTQAEVDAAVAREPGGVWQDWVSEWRVENGLLRADYFEERPCAWYVETWWFDNAGQLQRVDTVHEGSCASSNISLVR